MTETSYPSMVLVTGAAGFIGRHVCRYLLKLGWKVVGIDNFYAGGREHLSEFDGYPNWTFEECDIRSDLGNLFMSYPVEHVVHLAAIGKVRYSFENPQETHEVNFEGTQNLYRAASNHFVRRFIFASSSSVYGDQPTSPNHEALIPYPQSPYAMQKLAAEEWLLARCREGETPVVVFRFFNVFGTGANTGGDYPSLIGSSQRCIVEERPVVVNGDGLQLRDFTHVDNIVSGIFLGLTVDDPNVIGQPMNLGTGVGTTVLEVLQCIQSLAGGLPRIVHGPIVSEPRASIADIRLAERLLGYVPHIGLSAGLHKTIHSLLGQVEPADSVMGDADSGAVELAVYLKHDANVSIFSRDREVTYLELEKLTQMRYQSFSVDGDRFREEWLQWIAPHIANSRVSKIHWNWAEPEQLEVLRSLYPDCQEFVQHLHHESHVWSVYEFYAPAEGDLILCVDGKGDLDESYSVFEWRDGEIHLLLQSDLRLGVAYRMLGILSPEIDSDGSFDYGKNLGVPGKAMALAGYGHARKDWEPAIRDFYCNFRTFCHPSKNVAHLLAQLQLPPLPLDAALARDLIATSQKVFEELFLELAHPFLASSRYPRILLTGGCALNVSLNSRIVATYSKPVVVPPSPNDCGISLGIHRKVKPYASRASVYSGPALSIQLRSSLPPPLAAGVDALASVLAEGKVVGVVNGHCEIGPRALGNRSLLGNPFIAGMRDRMNMLKGREYYRPVAPIVLEEDIGEFFEEVVASPFMSFAPKVRLKYRELLQEVVHVDGTARVQTVGSEELFIRELLLAFGRHVPFPILMNTSLNLKGKPLVNSLEGAVDLLNSSRMEYLWINGYLYENPKT